MGVAVIVCTHGKAGGELINSAEMIMGEQENVRAIDFLPGEGLEDLNKKYQEAIDQLNTADGLLIFVDLVGGSPFNVAAQIALSGENIEVVAGVNIPMLIETLMQKDSQNLSELVHVADTSGKEGIKSLKSATEDTDDSGW